MCHSPAVHKTPRQFLLKDASPSCQDTALCPTVSKCKYCILQLRNMGRRVMFPTSLLNYFSSSLSGHVPSLLSWPSLPLFTLYPAYSSSFPLPPGNPLSWQKTFHLYTSSTSDGIWGFFTWLVNLTSLKLARKSLSNLTPSKAFLNCSSVLRPCTTCYVTEKTPYCSLTLFLRFFSHS